MTVTVADSIDAGNCDLATYAFQEDNFPGRDSVTVAELMPFLENDNHVIANGVATVLEYKRHRHLFPDGCGADECYFCNPDGDSFDDGWGWWPPLFFETE